MTALSSTAGDPTSQAVRSSSDPASPVRLSNGKMVVEVDQKGSGYTALGKAAVTRQPKLLADSPTGFFLYLRDLDAKACWSAALRPALVECGSQETSASGKQLTIRRLFNDIFTELQVSVDPHIDAELRRLYLVNCGSCARRLEITSYLEPVLGDGDLDASHPAFSKLFLETSWRPRQGALVARRRRRAPEEDCLVAAHVVLGATEACWDQRVEYETDRARFIGRGRDTMRPAAMRSANPLSGTVGPVLDPILSMRRFLSLRPGETAAITFCLVAAEDAASLDHQLEQLLARRDASAAWAAKVAESHTQRRTEGAFSLDSLPYTTESLPSRDISANDGQSRPRFQAAADAGPWPESAPPTAEPLLFENGIGGFTQDGKEYVIRLRPSADGGLLLPPMPWTNVVANEQAGFIVSETGAGYTWVLNSRENRLTPWSNDPISDPHSEALYVRDEASGLYWSPLPGPAPSNGVYEVRHGLGYTNWRHCSQELEQDAVQFVPREGSVKITILELRNLSNQQRVLSLYAYVRWEVGDRGASAIATTREQRDATSAALFVNGRGRGAFCERTAFAAVGSEPADQVFFCNDGEEFLGPTGTMATPLAILEAPDLPGISTAGRKPCAAIQLRIILPPHSERQVVFLLGEAADTNAAQRAVERFREPKAARAELAHVRDFWQTLTSRAQIKTPSAALDLMVNNWLPYQTLSCRLWGRSSLYQAGGAFGFRDQLQDASALAHYDPKLTRQQIIRHAAHQYPEGDVLHWWHPDSGPGLRTRFADDLLWLPLVAAEFVDATGDQALWHEKVSYQEADALDDGEMQRLVPLKVSTQSGTIYDHCCRAIDRSLRVGTHGLPLMGGGDWNDGMNRVGAGGAGESVWLGFFLYDVLERMLPVCLRMGDAERQRQYEGHRQQLAAALNDAGWDGQWYRRAFFDDATPLGSESSEECRIDALAQAWAVLSGAAPRDRADLAVAAVEKFLVDEAAGLIRLLTPPCDAMDHDPGYIKGYLPGVRENGGQYTHGVLWYIQALAELGHGTRATRLLEMLTPVHHTRTPEQVTVYQTEPYVVAADVYGAAPHVGRGGWSWYTGSAGWMLRVVLESLFGLRIENGTIMRLKPTIASDWTSCQFVYRRSETTYRVTIENPAGREQGASAATLDGSPVEVCEGAVQIPHSDDGQLHEVIVLM